MGVDVAGELHAAQRRREHEVAMGQVVFGAKVGVEEPDQLAMVFWVGLATRRALTHPVPCVACACQLGDAFVLGDAFLRSPE